MGQGQGEARGGGELCIQRYKNIKPNINSDQPSLFFNQSTIYILTQIWLKIHVVCVGIFNLI